MLHPVCRATATRTIKAHLQPIPRRRTTRSIGTSTSSAVHSPIQKQHELILKPSHTHETHERARRSTSNSPATTRIDPNPLLEDAHVLPDDYYMDGTRITDAELHGYLKNTILAAALKLKKYYQSSTTCSTNSDPQSKELFLQLRDRISSIIERLSALHQITAPPTAEQLAEAIPSEILGLYARFLVVFHQPNHGLKLMRKIYYAYLMGHRRNMMMTREEDQHPLVDPNLDLTQSSLVSAVETGSLIISLLRHKTHHRLAALKLVVRMITIGGIYPDHSHLNRLLRRMYMSKSEWDSTHEFIAQLADSDASLWLSNQMALVEAEDGRVERVLRLSAQALELPSGLQGDFLAPGTTSREIFSHAIQALTHPDPLVQLNNIHPSGLRGAIAIRTRMLECGMLPDSGTDDLILRRISDVTQGMKSRVSRHEFLAEMIAGMFPTCKIVPMRSEPLRNFRFASHPGKSPEAFRLMRWLIKSNELDLALHLFQSISRYGYVSSLAGIPFSYLKRLLDKALYSHPELAMELYQHLHMSGADRSGELFRAVKHKAIEMGDDRLAEYLLKRSDDQDGSRHATRITSFMTGFSRRRATPGNVMKTISLFDLIWARWSSLIEKTIWGALSDQIIRLGPVKLAQRPELRPQIDRLLRRLDEADTDATEVAKIKKHVMECVEVSKLIEADQETLTGSRTSEPPTEDVPSNEQTKTEGLQMSNAYDARASSVRKFEDLIQEYVREKRMDRAVEASKRAIEMEIVIPGPVVGQVLNGLVDALADDDNENEDDGARPDSGCPSSAVPAEAILLINQAWRAVAWKVNAHILGSDAEVVRAMDRFYQRTE
ncbi:hypothetical protein PCANC_20394 [Puccinia coronata f. sp. avenae]|uniref:Uncharacterized protein n=1 Tax=Puccinia coronata f. sp. avenae TaxID=200324 RepID=A0A2N5UEQ0_9BASI|nr:hypothetical protein PCANC_20394 [Puccinia coronata f. sp. avenae]PLW38918.1 hypothetical protein PCASD_11728 [Puccinia coronata f. sp. avenae]